MLPPVMMTAAALGADGKPQLTVPFGDGVLRCLDTTLAGERPQVGVWGAERRAWAWSSPWIKAHGLHTLLLHGSPAVLAFEEGVHFGCSLRLFT